tara:strand:- start:9525 stop:10553 length:1029 start_codon:yes stop_codon:yes gene_type:complete
MRRRINERLPKYVYRRRHGYIYRPYLGRLDGKSQWGKDVYLCGPAASMGQIWSTYEQATGQKTTNLRWLLGKYHLSEKFRELGRRTQLDYDGYRKIILNRELADGCLLGDVSFNDIDMYTIKQYLDTYCDKDGRRAPIAANRHIQYLKAAWNWARQRHPEVPPNPCTGVELNKQKPRTRLVTLEEYETALSLASGYIWIMMELAYLCRARRGEVAALKHSDVTDDGLRLVRTKGSEGEVTLWTPRLRAAVDRAKEFNRAAPTPIGGAYLIHDKHGLDIKKNAFDSAWRRLMDKVEAKGIPRFTYHDLKAAGITRHKDHHGGHRSEKMRKVYVRDLPKIEATE